MHFIPMALVAATLAFNFTPLSFRLQAASDPVKNVLLLGEGDFDSYLCESQKLALEDYDGYINFISEDYSVEESLEMEDYDTFFYNFLMEKETYYDNFDGVIATGEYALKFVMNHIDESDSIFYEIPVLYAGIDDLVYAEECSLHPWVDGIAQYVDIEKLIDLASDLSPYAHSVYYIYADNPAGIAYKSSVEEELEKNYIFDDSEIHPICSTDYTIEELGQIVQAINRQDITLFFNYSTDSEGNIYQSKEIAAKLDQYVDTIVITSNLDAVGTVATGGYFSSTEDIYLNEFAAMDYFFDNNVSLDEVPLEKDIPYNYIFDQAKLDEFSIYSIYLPNDSIIYNEELSFQERYPEAFVVVISLVVILVITTIVLISLYLTQISKTKKTKMMIDKINADVRRDKLTNLPGKYAFNQDIDQMIKNNKHFVLAMINIDNFEQISYLFGEQRKKMFLVVIANYIRNLISKKIKLYVYSEEEIILLFPLKNRRELLDYLNSLRNNRKIKYKVNDIELDITWTTGYAVFPENGKTRNELSTNANFALQYAKSKKKGSGLIFSYQKVMPFKRISELNELFKYSVQNRLLDNYYSPIVDLNTGKYKNLEVQVKVKGLNIPFEDCLKIASSTSIIRDFEKASIRLAMDFLTKYRKVSDTSLKLMIKIPVVELNDRKLQLFMTDKFKKKGVDLDNIIFQIDESFVNLETKAKDDFFGFVNSKKIGLCLEDFGEGYSSIKSLYGMNLEFIKFSSNITDDSYNQGRIETVKTFVDYLHGLGLKVCVNNIDSAKKAEFFRKAGCDFGEGTYFDFALSVDDMLENIESNTEYNHLLTKSEKIAEEK